MNFFLLLIAAIIIYLACEVFVNGVEWLGRKIGIGETATGTILAAFGTALPESVVTLVAVAFGDSPAQQSIGVGAALAGPMVLGTIAYGVVGFALMANRWHDPALSWQVNADYPHLNRDQGWFMQIFACNIALGLVSFPLKRWFSILFLVAYALYLRKEILGEQEHGEELEPLQFRPKDPNPSLGWAALQTGAALAVIYLASQFFVGKLEAVSESLGLAPQLTALLFSPIATEMPETMNAVIWVKQGREKLALANISGSMMIQATIPAALGIFFTPWRLDFILMVSALVTLLAITALFIMFRRGKVTGLHLAMVSLLYLVFAGSLFF